MTVGVDTGTESISRHASAQIQPFGVFLGGKNAQNWVKSWVKILKMAQNPLSGPCCGLECFLLD